MEPSSQQVNRESTAQWLETTEMRRNQISVCGKSPWHSGFTQVNNLWCVIFATGKLGKIQTRGKVCTVAPSADLLTSVVHPCPEPERPVLLTQFISASVWFTGNCENCSRWLWACQSFSRLVWTLLPFSHSANVCWCNCLLLSGAEIWRHCWGIIALLGL